MAGVLLTNINGFTESAARQITQSIAKLDRMTCTYVGPDALYTQYAPQYAAPHPEYPWMFCSDKGKRDIGAGLVEMTVTYQGRLTTNGLQVFISEHLMEFDSSEGELQYNNQPFSFLLSQTTTGSFTASGGTQETVINTYAVGVQKAVLHYLVEDVTFKYVTNYNPSNPAFINNNNTRVIWSYTRSAGISGYQAVIGSATQALVGLQLTSAPFGYHSTVQCTKFDPRQVIATWYEVTETWQIRYQNG